MVIKRFFLNLSLITLLLIGGVAEATITFSLNKVLQSGSAFNPSVNITTTSKGVLVNVTDTSRTLTGLAFNVDTNYLNEITFNVPNMTSKEQQAKGTNFGPAGQFDLIMRWNPGQEANMSFNLNAIGLTEQSFVNLLNINKYTPTYLIAAQSSRGAFVSNAGTGPNSYSVSVPEPHVYLSMGAMLAILTFVFIRKRLAKKV